MKRYLLAGLVVLILLAVFSSVSYVGSRESAVLDPRFGDPEILGPGFSIHAPFLSRVNKYPLDPRKVEGQVKVEARDNMNFRVRYSLQTSLDPGTLLTFHARRAGRPLAPVLQQLSDETVQKAATLLRADEILGTAPRERWLGALVLPARERGLKALEIEVTPVDSRALVNAALIYQERNLPNAALALLRIGAERFPQDSLVHFGLGRLYEHHGRQKEAEDEYLQALLLDPVATEPMGRLIGALLTRREFDRAQRLLDAALEKDPDSAPHHHWIGVVLQLQAKYDDAEKAFRRAVELDPKSAEYRAGLGALLLSKGDPAGAQEPLKEAIRIEPNFTLALYNLGIALAMQDKPTEAIPFFEQAERTAPPTVGLLNALAKAYRETGQTPKAISALRRSLRLKPGQKDQEMLLRQLEAARPRAAPRAAS